MRAKYLRPGANVWGGGAIHVWMREGGKNIFKLSVYVMAQMEGKFTASRSPRTTTKGEGSLDVLSSVLFNLRLRSARQLVTGACPVFTIEFEAADKRRMFRLAPRPCLDLTRRWCAVGPHILPLRRHAPYIIHGVGAPFLAALVL